MTLIDVEQEGRKEGMIFLESFMRSFRSAHNQLLNNENYDASKNLWLWLFWYVSKFQTHQVKDEK